MRDNEVARSVEIILEQDSSWKIQTDRVVNLLIHV